MFTFLRSRVRFAGRIGWIDGRRGYPGEEQFVELVVHRPLGEQPVLDATASQLADPSATAGVAHVHPLAVSQRS